MDKYKLVNRSERNGAMNGMDKEGSRKVGDPDIQMGRGSRIMVTSSNKL